MSEKTHVSLQQMHPQLMSIMRSKKTQACCICEPAQTTTQQKRLPNQRDISDGPSNLAADHKGCERRAASTPRTHRGRSNQQSQ
jgi:hypothetical protein